MTKKFGVLTLIAIFLLGFPLQPVSADQKKDMGGWEKDSEYNKHYDISEYESFKGWIKKIKTVTPMPGMSPAVAIEVCEDKKLKSEPILVHLCPIWFADPGTIGLKRGDRVKVKGVWAEIDDKDVFMASKVKKGDYFEFKARLSSDGTPFWTLSDEELAKEREASQAALKKQ